MKMSVYANRIGGFTSVNQGEIRDCFTDAKVKHAAQVAGFAYENSGEIGHAVAQGKTAGKENVAGFCGKNSGKLNACGWLDRIEPQPEGENAPKTEKKPENEKKKKSEYTDKKLAIQYTNLAERTREMGFVDGWIVTEGAKARMKHDRKFHFYTVEAAEGAEVIEISDASQLMQLAVDIAGGNTEAAAGHYRLTGDINCKGKKIFPIGLSENVPFTGKFDGAGYKIHNFKVVAKDLECAGLFGYIKDGTVAKTSLKNLSTLEELGSLMTLVGDTVKATATRLKSGHAEATPLLLGNGRFACTGCSYYPVCRNAASKRDGA